MVSVIGILVACMATAMSLTNVYVKVDGQEYYVI